MISQRFLILYLVLLTSSADAADIDQELFKSEQVRSSANDGRELTHDYQTSLPGDRTVTGKDTPSTGVPKNMDIAADYNAPPGESVKASDTQPYKLGDKIEVGGKEPHAESTKASASDVKDDTSGDCCSTGRYSKGTWGAIVYGGGYKAYTNVKSVYCGAVGGEYFVLDDFSVNVELVGYSVQQKNFTNSAGAGINALGRWHPLKSSDERLAMYVEAGAGLADFSARTPGPNGSHFNGTIEAGIGGRFQIDRRIGVIVGPRWFHISNGGTSSNGNPSINSVGGYGGISIKF